jgi:hypothetical protein
MKKKILRRRYGSANPKFRVVAEYNGYSQIADKRIESVAPRNVSGSGSGPEGRDISFMFVSEKAANRAAARLKRFKGVRVGSWKEE